MKEDKTPKEYKLVSGSTVFLVKKIIRGEMGLSITQAFLSLINYSLNVYVGDKSESTQKARNVRLPQFTELLRHERMQDLVRK